MCQALDTNWSTRPNAVPVEKMWARLAAKTVRLDRMWTIL
jgi:hypothetical protein